VLKYREETNPEETLVEGLFHGKKKTRGMCWEKGKGYSKKSWARGSRRWSPPHWVHAHLGGVWRHGGKVPRGFERGGKIQQREKTENVLEESCSKRKKGSAWDRDSQQGRNVKAKMAARHNKKSFGDRASGRIQLARMKIGGRRGWKKEKKNRVSSRIGATLEICRKKLERKKDSGEEMARHMEFDNVQKVSLGGAVQPDQSKSDGIGKKVQKERSKRVGEGERLATRDIDHGGIEDVCPGIQD